MPETISVGTPGPANQKIGGVPTVHYFDFQSKGRGQVVRIFLEDAGIAYKDIRYSFQEYPDFKKSQLSEMNPQATIPVVELNGKILTQSYAIIRHFSRVLGAYDGTTEDEKYFTDAICDVVVDWRTQFLAALFNPNKEEEMPKYQAGKRVNFMKGLDAQLGQSPHANAGPYVLGNTITYADVALYQIMHDEGLTKDGRAGLKDYPRLTKLVDAFEQRPNVKAFLTSERYKG